ncbi:MAG: recombinase family protein [Vicinamibacterales bacterium]
MKAAHPKRSPLPVLGKGSGKTAPASVPASKGIIFGYGRVSKSDGRQRADLQLDALREAKAERIFVDHISGASHHLPEFERMLDMVRPGDTVIVWKLDRLSRSGARSTINAVHSILDKGANFRSLTEDMLNVSGPFRDMMLALLGALASMERNSLIERTKAGMQAAVARGAKLGRKPSLTDEQIVHLVHLRERKKWTFPRIGKLFGVAHTTVFRAYNKVLLEREEAAMLKQAARPNGRRARVAARSSR